MIDVQAPDLADDHVLAERIVLGAIEAYRAMPFRDVDARAVAERARVTPARVEEAFPVWDALLIVVYDRWVELRGAGRRSVPANTLEYVRMTLAEDVADPGLVRILAGAITIADSGGTFGTLFRQRYEEYYTAMVAGLTRDFASGAIESVVAPEHAATQLLALYEGLQLQMIARPHIDALQQYDVAASTLRSGWGSRAPREWDLDG